MSQPRDVLGRPLRDLRVSVTDRCNFRCPYCMPREVFGASHLFLPKPEILTFEEITRVVAVLSSLGVRKVRLTGGEPLLRRDLAVLVGMLSEIESLEDLALTTNGLLLRSAVKDLKHAGLQRVTVSLDALDNDVFRAMSGSERPVEDVLDGIVAARDTGLPVKINCVVQRGVNEDQILPLAEWCREERFTLRFIEYMDVGNRNEWHQELVLPSRELAAAIHARWPMTPREANYHGEVAERYVFDDGRGEIGFISSVSQPFCRDCSRARLSSDGLLYTCLFATHGTDLRGPLRAGASDAELTQFLTTIWRRRDDRYSEHREVQAAREQKVEMFHIGG